MSAHQAEFRITSMCRVLGVTTRGYYAWRRRPISDRKRVDGMLDWVAMGGFPHGGKMYGFYDPNGPAGSYTGAFNTGYLAALRGRRGDRLQAYNRFRASLDPEGRFYNEFLRTLMEG